MRGSDIMRDLERVQAQIEHALDQTNEPWHRLIGKARLQPSEFVARGQFYVLDLKAAGMARGERVTRAVVAHPDTMSELRLLYPTLGSDAELAALLVWKADVKGLNAMAGLGKQEP
jgi:hypothetical protein